MSTEIRKVQRSGNSSFVVSLPMDWVKSHKIEKNDPVEMTLHPDGTLSLSARGGPARGEETKVMEVTGATPGPLLLRRLYGAYVNGCPSIRVNASGAALPAAHKVVTQFLGEAMGQEIVEEDERGFLLKDILNSSELNMEKTVRRMHNISRKMLTDTFSTLKDGGAFPDDLGELEHEMDRLNMLVGRKHSLFLRYPINAQKEGLSLQDSNMYFLTARNMERIADHANRIVYFTPHLGAASKSAKARKRLSELGSEALKAYDAAMATVYGRNSEAANAAIGAAKDLSARIKAPIVDLGLEGQNLVAAANMTESVHRISEYSVNVCENVMNSYP